MTFPIDLFLNKIWLLHCAGFTTALGLFYLIWRTSLSPEAQTPERKSAGRILLFGFALAAIALLVNSYRLFGLAGSLFAFIAGVLLTRFFLKSGSQSPNFYPFSIFGPQMAAAMEQEMARQWDQALALYRQIEYMAEKEQYPWARVLANAYSARILRNQGRTDEALQVLASCQRILDQLPPDGRKDYLENEASLVAGTVHMKLPLPRDHEEAKKQFEKTITACRALLECLDKDGPMVAYMLRPGPMVSDAEMISRILLIASSNIDIAQINLAEVYLHEDEGQHKAGEIANALIEKYRSIEIAKPLGGAYRIKGEIALRQNDLDEALQWYRKALKIYERDEFSRSPETYASVQNAIQQITLFIARKIFNDNGSHELFPELERVPEARVYHDLPELREVDIQAVLMPLHEAWHKYYNAALRWDDAGWRDRSYTYLVKAVACLDELRENIPLRGSYPSERRSEFYGKNAQAPLGVLVDLLLSPEARRIPQVIAPLEEAFYYREKLGALGLLDEMEASKLLEKGRISNISSEMEIKELLKCRVSRVGEIQDCLPPNTYIVEYVFSDRLLAAFLISKDEIQAPIYLRLSEDPNHPSLYSKWETMIREFTTSIGDHVNESGRIVSPRLPREKDLSKVKYQSKALYDLLIAPLNVPWSKGAAQDPLRIIFVPHGELHELPFTALYDGECFLIEKACILQSPIASLLCQTPPQRTAGSKPLLYFGYANPESDERLVSEQIVLQSARAFGYSGDWRENCITVENPPIKGVRKNQATKSSLLNALCGCQIIDLETHGEYNPTEPLKSGFRILEDNGESSTFFQAEEILSEYRMNIDLLVAATCNGGQAKVNTGDEVVGLSRAFLFAGCRNILLYRWRLYDKAAELFLGVFYPRLAANLPGEMEFDLACQAAQIALIQRGRRGEKPTELTNKEITWEHPHYWAWTLLVSQVKTN